MRTLGPLLSNVWLRDGPLRLFEFRPRERLEPWFCLMTSVFVEVIPASQKTKNLYNPVGSWNAPPSKDELLKILCFPAFTVADLIITR